MNWYKQSQNNRRTQINPNSLSNLTTRKSLIPEDIQKQIIDMYKAKEDGGQQITMTNITNYFNLNIDAVRRILINNNIPLRSRTNLTPSQEQSIFQLYKSPEDGGSGMNYTEIARSIGKPDYYKGIMGIVKRLAEKENYPLRADPHAKTILTPEDIKKILHLWDNGETVTNLKKMFSTQLKEIYQILDKNSRNYKRGPERFNPSPEDVDYLLQLFNNGESLNAIADLFGVSNKTISDWLEKGGYREKEVSSFNKYIDIAPMVGYMYASPNDGGEGMTMQQISQALNMTHQAVSTALQRANVKTRPSAAEPMPFSEEEQRRMVDLYNSGKSINDITKEMGVSKTPIERVIFREQNIVPRNQSESKKAWWKEYFANNPGGFDAYLSRFPESKQREIRRVIGIKRRVSSQVIASTNWYKESQIKPIKGQPKDCFRNSRLAAKENPSAEVVHGRVFSQMDNRMIDHAWVEMGGIVYDPTIDLQIDKDRYYELTKAEVINRLSSEEVQVLHIRTGKDGLYTAEEVGEYRQIKNRSEERLNKLEDRITEH